MTLVCINPDGLPTPETYSQVVVATGSKWVFVSGQEPEDMHGNLVGCGDLAAQARPCTCCRRCPAWAGLVSRLGVVS